MAGRDCIIVSAGPSTIRENTIDRLKHARREDLAIVCMDASLLRLIKCGIVPDYCVVIDPHPTRMLRWFGDPWLEEHISEDEYFIRQDLDIAFRNASREANEANIELLNHAGREVSLIAATILEPKLLKRFQEIKFKNNYWFTPLVDDPTDINSLTRKLFEICDISCMNTGGNVGCAAWIYSNFIANAKRIGAIGMDYSYYEDVPYIETQTYYELLALAEESRIDDYFVWQNGVCGRKFYQDPTFYWYCDNFLSLVAKSEKPLYNLSEAGLLYGENIVQESVEGFING